LSYWAVDITRIGFGFTSSLRIISVVSLSSGTETDDWLKPWLRVQARERCDDCLHMTYNGHRQHQQPTSDDKASADCARQEMPSDDFSAITSVAIAAIARAQRSA
jgi:hypothetical protein